MPHTSRHLLAYGTAALTTVDGVRLIGTARRKASILSFVLEGVHPHDIGTIVDREGVAIRTGHHCAQPVMDRFGVPATARASLAIYNTREEIDALVRAWGGSRKCSHELPASQLPLPAEGTELDAHSKSVAGSRQREAGSWQL